MWNTAVNRRLSAARLGLLVALTMTATACDDDPVAPDATVFEGEIAGVGAFEDMTGQASFELGANELAITITLDEHPEQGDGFPWILREGACADPGDAIGELADFPLIELDENDEWSADVELELEDGTLDLDAEAEAYVIEIRSSEDEETVIGCGDLERA
jgi:hypothetical protein